MIATPGVDYLEQQAGSPMASPSIPAPLPCPALDEQPLTREQGWDLIFSLFGTAKQAYAGVGGSEAWIRSERAAWSEDAAH